ncbi:dihydrodipicolinate synthase family protein [Streptomyces sp. NPDC057702]|uniref:dihydrodipicolinate synthase family protein n=1 Tax=unclassified Streptomyces TaxID=2593676 RepID=UPI0036A12AAD
MAKPLLTGIISYPVTPFAPDGGLDLDALRRLADDLVTAGSHGIAPLGSTGESAYLTEAEWDAVCETTLDAVAGRVPTVVGVAHFSTRGTVRRARVAARHGATAIMVLPQVYWRLTDAELARHFAAVAEASDLPVMLYNNPATSGVDLPPRAVAALARAIPNLTMVKESSGDATRFRALRELSDGALSVYNGSNPLALDAFRSGAVGWCTAAPNLAPRACRDLYEAATGGQPERADAMWANLLPLLKLIVSHGLPRTIKAGLELRGRGVGQPRPPLLPLPPSETEQLRHALERLGVHPLLSRTDATPAPGLTV